MIKIVLRNLYRHVFGPKIDATITFKYILLLIDPILKIKRFYIPGIY